MEWHPRARLIDASIPMIQCFFVTFGGLWSEEWLALQGQAHSIQVVVGTGSWTDGWGWCTGKVGEVRSLAALRILGILPYCTRPQTPPSLSLAALSLSECTHASFFPPTRDWFPGLFPMQPPDIVYISSPPRAAPSHMSSSPFLPPLLLLSPPSHSTPGSTHIFSLMHPMRLHSVVSTLYDCILFLSYSRYQSAACIGFSPRWS